MESEKMKLEHKLGGAKRSGKETAFGKACAASCQKILAQISAAKAAIFAESYQALKAQERLLRLALNEAEATAWQTLYPQLIFPVLATEKVQAVMAWEARQQAVRSASPAFPLAA
jgi:hypothetical protein